MLDDGGVETPFNESCYNMRERLKVLARQVQGLKVLCVEEVTYAYVGTTEVFARPPEGAQDRGEMIANVMLAYRHLEDAAMRLGKAVQAFDGGQSVYPR
jgi:hypothetical protein